MPSTSATAVKVGACAVGLHALLEEGLGVRRVLGTLGRQMRLERAVDELRRRIPAGIEVERAHEGLVDILERGMKTARTGAGLRRAEDDELVDTELM